MVCASVRFNSISSKKSYLPFSCKKSSNAIARASFISSGECALEISSKLICFLIFHIAAPRVNKAA
jgi:hypothetical protein